ncbi:MAG: AIR synthase-related protein, partial [Spirochaetota bacterium]
GYDLCVGEETKAEMLQHFTSLHLADPVCDQYLIQDLNTQDVSTPSVNPSTNPSANPLGANPQWLPPAPPSDSPAQNHPGDCEILAYETLAAQFDPRAGAVQDCWNLWSSQSACRLYSVRCFWLYQLYPKQQGSKARFSAASLEAAQQFLCSPLELQVKDFQTFSYNARMQEETRKETLSKTDAGTLTDPALTEGALRFDPATLAYIHDYYNGRQLPGIAPQIMPLEPPREPSPTELRILEAYWSDHCRHTTFHTELEWPEQIPPPLQPAFDLYQKLRRQCQMEHKPQCLMDIATLGANALRASSSPYIDAVETSAEVNACSVFVDVSDNCGGSQKRLLMFKNETHNHPTEIEPYGGAATCLGGAIRDPLSGRSYVYQALRLSGAASPAQDLSAVRPGKLPQRKICTDSARGFSDYGNRIGLATNFVRELYHPGFEAKRFECGMVVGVADPQQVRRLEPRPGDFILLLGGATGRDGIGGASGSSTVHDSNTIAHNSAEVQRGNPIEERKLQRFFRRSDVGHLIKRCNDFGAGGVAVAVGEIAESLEIDLAAMPLKYQGLTASELAVSESQERMAVVIAASNWEGFCEKARSEGISAVKLGEVKDGPARFRLMYRGIEVANLARDFLDSSGTSRRAALRFHSDYLRPYSGRPSYQQGPPPNNPVPKPQPIEQIEQIEATLCETLRRPQIAGQQGLQHMFDSSVGSSTVFQPYPREVGKTEGGRPMATYGCSEVSAQLIPLSHPLADSEHNERGKSSRYAEHSESASVISFAYDADLSSHNTFLGAQVAIVQSAAKLLAAGVRKGHIYLSLQEYFPRLASPELWGQAGAALLGALQAQHELGLAAIGGKDSMSGTFEELQVPPVLSSFAFGTAPCNQLRPSNWQKSARHLYLLGSRFSSQDSAQDSAQNSAQDGSGPAASGGGLHSPDYERTRSYWEYLDQLGNPENQISARLVGTEGVLG